jgi:hypothetical protein
MESFFGNLEIETEIILNLYPGYYSVLGPYKREDDRQHIVLNNSTASKGTKGKTKTISYPKAIYETMLNRRLIDNEEIDHKDGDKTNDRLSNYQVLTKIDNIQKQIKEGNHSLFGRNKVLKK